MDFVDEMDMVPLCPCGADPGPKGDLPGKLMWLTMDSGAGKSCTSKKLASRFNITPSAGSRAGQKFCGPDGEVYKNEGEVKLPFLTETGNKATGEFQVIDGLYKTLAAISDSCDRGNLAVFDNDGSFLINCESEEGRATRKITKEARQKLEMYRKNGVYVMPVWLQDAVGVDAPFAGRGI